MSSYAFAATRVIAEAPERTLTPPTQRQADFLRSLARQVHGDGAEAWISTLEWSKAEVSKAIDSLKGVAWNATRPPDTVKDAPEGVHLLGGTVYRVKVSKSSGRTYATELVGTTWQYVGRSPMDRLSGGTLVTREQAAEYGVRTGVCCVCGTVLENTESIERGIGPVCASKF